MGRRLGPRPGWGGSGFPVQMAGPGICLLCLADTWASEVHPVFNPVRPY